MKPVISLLLILIGYIFTYSWLILPKETYFKPFLFLKDFEVTKRFYFEYIMARVFVVLLLIVIDAMSEIKEMRIAVWLFVGYAIDFALIYNQPFGYLQGGSFTRTHPDSGFFIPLSYSLFLGAALLMLTIWVAVKY